MEYPEYWKSLNGITPLLQTGKLQEAEQQLEELSRKWKEADLPGPEGLSLGAAMVTMRGHLHAQRGDRDGAAETYQEALAMLEEDGDEEKLLNQKATILGHRGMLFLSSKDETELAAAGGFLEEAIQIRDGLSEEIRISWGQAAAWMNRAEIWSRRSHEYSMPEAVRCYDEAIRIQEAMPDRNSVASRCRLAIAWMNRGLAMRESEEPEHQAETRKSLETAVHVLESSPDSSQLEIRRLLAATRLNQATYLLEHGTPEENDAVREGARKASAVITEEEAKTDFTMGEAWIRSRFLQCRAIGFILEASERVPMELADEASDLVESGLDLEQLWLERGREDLRFLALELFRFGCRLYGNLQPQFLAEYATDYAKPKGQLRPEFARMAIEELTHVSQQMQQRGAGKFGSPEFLKWQEIQGSILLALDELKVES